MTTSTSPRRSTRNDRHWWQTLLETVPALLDLPGTLGDLVGEVSSAALDDAADFLPGKRRSRTGGRHRAGKLDVLDEFLAPPASE
jgi:hypothetical protein